jgi:hypothetical protein
MNQDEVDRSQQWGKFISSRKSSLFKGLCLISIKTSRSALTTHHRPTTRILYALYKQVAQHVRRPFKHWKCCTIVCLSLTRQSSWNRRGQSENHIGQDEDEKRIDQSDEDPMDQSWNRTDQTDRSRINQID